MAPRAGVQTVLLFMPGSLARILQQGGRPDLGRGAWTSGQAGILVVVEAQKPKLGRLHQPAREIGQQATRTDDLLLGPGAGEQLVDELIAEPITNLRRKLCQRRALRRPRSSQPTVVVDAVDSIALKGRRPGDDAVGLDEVIPDRDIIAAAI